MQSRRGSNPPPRSTLPLRRSTTRVGGRRPPGPTTTGGGSGLPRDSTAVSVAPISVRVRPADEAPPGRYSATFPATRTASPTATSGLVRVKTNTPSDVPWSRSGRGSCIQKPLPVSAVTTPGTRATAEPFSGEMCAAPCTSRIRTAGAAACAAGGAASGAARTAAARALRRPCTTRAP